MRTYLGGQASSLIHLIYWKIVYEGFYPSSDTLKIACIEMNICGEHWSSCFCLSNELIKAKLIIGDTLKGDLHNASQRIVLIRDCTNYHCSTWWDEKEVLFPRTLIGSKELIIGSRWSAIGDKWTRIESIVNVGIKLEPETGWEMKSQQRLHSSHTSTNNVLQENFVSARLKFKHYWVDSKTHNIGSAFKNGKYHLTDWASSI